MQMDRQKANITMGEDLRIELACLCVSSERVGVVLHEEGDRYRRAELIEHILEPIWFAAFTELLRDNLADTPQIQ